MENWSWFWLPTKMKLTFLGTGTSTGVPSIACDCETCTTFSRGYLRHLFMAEELLGLRLLSLHNVRYLIRLAHEMRDAIRRNAFGPWAVEWRRRYLHSGSA